MLFYVPCPSKWQSWSSSCKQFAFSTEVIPVHQLDYRCFFTQSGHAFNFPNEFSLFYSYVQEAKQVHYLTNHRCHSYICKTLDRRSGSWMSILFSIIWHLPILPLYFRLFFGLFASQRIYCLDVYRLPPLTALQDMKNNAWVTVNNDFWVMSEAICQ